VAAFSIASVLGRLPLLWVGDRLGLRFMLAAGANTVAAGELLFAIASVGLAAYTNYVALYADQLGQRTVVTEFAVLVGGTAVARLAAGGLVERAGPRLSAVGFLLLAGGGLLAAAT
jgi:hypothetical protein